MKASLKDRSDFFDIDAAIDDEERHWFEQWNRRLHSLGQFLETIPARYQEQVEEELFGVADILSRLLTPGPAFAPEGSSSLMQWAMVRSTWGEFHPWNRCRPDPTPEAFLDLLITYSGADLWPCQACGIPLPQRPPSGRLGVPYKADVTPWVRPYCLTATCPVCSTTIPRGRTGVPS